jgi:hypothetical protein
MAVARNRVNGNLYLNDDGTGVITANGSGLQSASVSFDSVARGTPGYVATYKAAAPNAGMLTSGIAMSTTTQPGALVIWDIDGKIDGITTNGGDISTNTVNTNTVTSDSVTINNTPILLTDAATVEFVNNAVSSIVGGFTWLEPVINFWSDPSLLTPADGDRYTALATIGPWTVNNIYEWNAGTSLWDETVVVDGMAVTSLQGDPFTPIVGPSSYIFTSGAWTIIGFNGAHDNLVGKNGTTSVSSVNTPKVGPIVDSIVYSWATVDNRAYTSVIELVGISSAAAGHARFSWTVDVVNHSGVATFTTSKSSTYKAGNLSTATASLAIKVAPNDEFMDIRVSIPGAVTSTWHATIEGTYVIIAVP